VILIVALAAFVVALPGIARAAVVHPFKEPFGSLSQPTFTKAQALAVDQTSGDLLVVDATAQTLSRFKPNGEPDPFTALGTNVIDAKKGPGNKPCGEEPMSCDGTPESGFFFGVSAAQVQITVDNSSNVLTNGNIYVTQASKALVDIFGSDGHYVGQIKEFLNPQNEIQKFKRPGVEFVIKIPGYGTTEPMQSNASNATICEKVGKLVPGGVGGATCITGLNAEKTITFKGGLEGINVPPVEIYNASTNVLIETGTTTQQGGLAPTALGAVCGIATAPDGTLFLGDTLHGAISPLVHKYVPSANPPIPADNTANFKPSSNATECNLASGASATAGSLFGTRSLGGFEKRNSSSGAELYNFGSGSGTTVAVNPASGRVLGTVGSIATEFDASDVAAAVSTSTLEASSAIEGLAVNKNTGDVYISRSGGPMVEVFGPSVATPTPKLFPATEIGQTKATVNGSVNSEGSPLTECKFEYLSKVAFEENGNSYTGPKTPAVKSCAENVPNDLSAHPVSAVLGGLSPEQTYHYRLVAKNPATTITGDGTFTTAPALFTENATAVTNTTATLNGSLNPVGVKFDTCKFEYLTEADYGANGNQYTGPKVPQSKPCSPPVSGFEDFSSHSVSAALTSLAQSTTYHFRLVATKGVTTYAGGDLTFTTLGPPIVSATVPVSVDQDSATLQASVNPNGAATNYRFEWGADGSYGHSAPADVEPSLGSGTTVVAATAKISGLPAASQFHFRIVARNTAGTTVGPDATFETLNGCGFVQQRCLELVSPPDKGPVGEVGEVILQVQPRFRPAAHSSKVAYMLGYGLPDSTAGGEVVYQADREDLGWQSNQLSPISTESSNVSNLNVSGIISYLSDDLDCTYLTSLQALTPDAPRAVIDAGKANFFLRRDDGSYALLTPRVPSNLPAQPQYRVIGASSDCERVVFSADIGGTPADFVGLGGGLYEWDHGDLRSLARIPGVAGVVPAKPGAGYSNYWNAMAADCTEAHHPLPCLGSGESRVAFTAVRQESALGAEVGKTAVFVRKNGSETIDVSKSSTSTPDTGAVYQTSSTDGKKAFFLANYGLTSAPPGGWPTTCSGGNGGSESGTGAGCDLYAYDETKPPAERLSDLTATTNPANSAGAAVAGVLGASDDGSYVYFAARGQLILNKGNTYQQNLGGAGSYNVYLSHQGALSYVGLVAATDFSSASDSGARIGIWQSTFSDSSKPWSSRVTPDGRHLLFQSTAKVTEYNNGGTIQAYLYSAPDGAVSGQVECVSCRRDGQPSVAEAGLAPLPTARAHVAQDVLHPPVILSEDGSEVFFWSPDALSVGAVQGQVNLYEWRDGQISLLSTGVPGIANSEIGRGQLHFAGASADGQDIYFSTPRALVPQDSDERQDLYDARVGGGFAPPPAPAAPCDPLSESSCQGAPQVSGTSTPPPSSTIAGEGNAKPAPQKKNKKKHHKKKHHKQGKANSNRRAGK
jgi:hypothetical protein